MSSIIVAETPEVIGAQIQARAIKLVRKTLFDLTVEELNRLDILAKMLVSSQLSYAKNGSKTWSESDLKLVMLKGLEIGMGLFMSLEAIDLISGKPTLDPAGMLALAQSAGELEDIVFHEESDTASDITIKRRGQSPYRRRWTIQDAAKMTTKEWSNGASKNIPLTEKQNWKEQPAVMLKWRNVSAICRVIFGDIIQGMYTPEELGADVIIDESGRMTSIQQPVAQLSPANPVTSAVEWYKDAEKIALMHTVFIKHGYAKDDADAKSLLADAGVTEEFLAQYPRIEDASPQARKLVDAHLAKGAPAQPSMQPTTPEAPTPPAAPELSLAPRATPTYATTLDQDMDAYVSRVTPDITGELAGQIGRSWSEIGNRTEAETEVNMAIVKHCRSFVCTSIRYMALGAGKKIELVTPNKYGVKLAGGMGALRTLMGADADAFFAAHPGIEESPLGTTPIVLKTPIMVDWSKDSKGNDKVINLELVPPMQQQAAAA